MTVTVKGWCKVVQSDGTQLINLDDGVNYMLEWAYPGDPVRDETWIHPAGGYSYLARSQDRPSQASICLHILPQGTWSGLKAKVRAVRDAFATVGTYIEFGQGSTDFLRFKTYPTAIPSPLKAAQLPGMLATSQFRVLDWEINPWHDPYPVAASDNGAITGVSGGTALDAGKLPML